MKRNDHKPPPGDKPSKPKTVKCQFEQACGSEIPIQQRPRPRQGK